MNIYHLTQIETAAVRQCIVSPLGGHTGSQQERPRRGPGNQIYLIANPATTIHQEHAPRITIIPLLDNSYDAFDYDNHICEH